MEGDGINFYVLQVSKLIFHFVNNRELGLLVQYYTKYENINELKKKKVFFIGPRKSGDNNEIPSLSSKTKR